MFIKIFKKLKKRIVRVPDRFLWYLRIRKIFKQDFLKNKNNKNWESDYSKYLLHHSHQNKMISLDFLRECKKRKYFFDVLKNSSSILDFGCGSGELSNFIYKKYKTKKIIGAETSSMAVNVASFLYHNNDINFLLINPEDDLKNIGKFDLVVCSQVLEHFRGPFKIIDKLLEISSNIIILVPYGQVLTGDYEKEGGLQHVFSFTEESFKKYNVVDSFVFKSLGWDYGEKGEEPMEFAVLIRK